MILSAVILTIQAAMIKVNGKPMEWHEGITFRELYSRLGFKLSSPPVIVRVDGKTIKKRNRDVFEIKDGSEIEIISALRGG